VMNGGRFSGFREPPLIRAFCCSSDNDKFGAGLTAASQFLRLAVGDEIIRIEDYGFYDDAAALRLRNLAFCPLLPLIKIGRELIPVIHDFPDTLVVFASVPRSNVWHSSALIRLGWLGGVFRCLPAAGGTGWFAGLFLH
jgi:hypothetical protein